MMPVGVIFILLTEQEKEEGGEFHSVQRFSPDMATAGEFGYEHIHMIFQVIHTQQITCLPHLMWRLILLNFFFFF